MSERIRQLEDALAITQASLSRDTHPLLRDELLAVKWGVQVKTGPTEEEEAVDKEIVKPFGTLIISDQGVSRFFGPSGGTEVGGFFPHPRMIRLTLVSLDSPYSWYASFRSRLIDRAMTDYWLLTDRRISQTSRTGRSAIPIP